MGQCPWWTAVTGALYGPVRCGRRSRGTKMAAKCGQVGPAHCCARFGPPRGGEKNISLPPSPPLLGQYNSRVCPVKCSFCCDQAIDGSLFTALTQMDWTHICVLRVADISGSVAVTGGCGDVRFEVFTAVTMKNVVFWDIKPQSVLHRRHITSPLQSPAG
jgi:hypothetical protein